MNFLDSPNWNNLRELEEEYDQENLTEELIGQLHERYDSFSYSIILVNNFWVDYGLISYVVRKLRCWIYRTR